ncbi:hypothetical protein D3C72_1940000 [compost metagenome]
MAGIIQYIAIDPFSLRHLALKGQAQANHAAPLQAAGAGAEKGFAVDQQCRAVKLDLAGFFVVAAVHVEPGQDVGAGADGHAVTARRWVEQLWHYRHRGIGVIALQCQRGT